MNMIDEIMNKDPTRNVDSDDDEDDDDDESIDSQVPIHSIKIKLFSIRCITNQVTKLSILIIVIIGFRWCF